MHIGYCDSMHVLKDKVCGISQFSFKFMFMTKFKINSNHRLDKGVNKENQPQRVNIINIFIHFNWVFSI